jgi:hypothetical protein
LPFRRRASLRSIVPSIVRGLALTSVLCNALGLSIVLLGVAFSKLSLHG